MKFGELAKRNLKEAFRDPLSVSVTIALPVGLMLILSVLGKQIEDQAPQLSATMLAPGVTLFGFSMLVFSSSYLLARDREGALLTRLLTAPLSATDFIAAYSIPYLPVAIVQIVAIYGVGFLLGLEIVGSTVLVFFVLLVMAIGYIGLGMLMGSLLSSKQVSIGYSVVLLLTIFSGTWFEVEVFGETFTRIMNALPFAHALSAARDVMVLGAGFDDIATDFYWVLGYTVIFFVLGILAFRRKMVE
jgi:ABC-2 type transport system permease protein